MNRIFTILLAALIALAPAFAEKGNRQRKGGKGGACKADIERLCGAHKGDKKAMRACIKANADQLSPECKAKKEQFKAKRAERKERYEKVMKTCEKDVQQFCKAEDERKQHSMRCLFKNRDKLSAECKAVLPQKRVRKEK
jgi:flagellar motility protein MotE (MotC chaperone)